MPEYLIIVWLVLASFLGGLKAGTLFICYKTGYTWQELMNKVKKPDGEEDLE